MPHLGQVSELLARLALSGLLHRHAGGAGRPNAWWPTPYGEQIAQTLEKSSRHFDTHPGPQL
jgi:hypothetical protein